VTDLPGVLFSTPAMAAVWSGEARVQRMLDFEAALARAEARTGVIPAEAAEPIGRVCSVGLYDVAAIYRETGPAGTPAIPLVRMLTERVEGEAKRYVHWGATSQDAIDTGMVLQARDALRLLETDLRRLARAAAGLAERHRATPMAGRTLLQQALPITFGLKAARWLAMTDRLLAELPRLRERVLVVQLGGAAGTLASLGGDGPRAAELLAEELDLGVPDLPWHAERDRVGALAGWLGVVAGAMAKIGRDVALLAQSEVGEVAEGAAPGKGGSSTLPQKRNPVDATFAVAAARIAIGQVPVLLGAMAQEHERAAGGWQAEWAALPTLFNATAAAVDRVCTALEGLEVDAERMAANLRGSGGLLMAESLSFALARQVGRPEAQRLVKEWIAAKRDLREAALELLSADEVGAALDPANYLGATQALIDRALSDYRGAMMSFRAERGISAGAPDSGAGADWQGRDSSSLRSSE
jgi:3-carboxy-cis,cis-muconate cycloisomerase